MHTALEKVCEVLGGERFRLCESASLRLEKFVRLGKDDSGKETKRQEIEDVVSKNQRGIPQPLPKGGVRFVARLGGRLIVNQAGGILENAGLCLHRHFNAPYIPGSAVKGCARHAAWQAWEEAEEGEAKIAAAKEVAEIFGFPTGDKGLDEYLKEYCGYEKAQSGKVAFLAAVPETTARLAVDLVNCHHSEYYAGRRPEATDCESPIPNFFPVVEAGTRFSFTVVPCGASDALLDRARHFLVSAMTESGLGAKTAAGYGWFEYDEKAELERMARIKAEEERRNQEKVAAAAAAAKAAADAARRAARATMGLDDLWNEKGAKAVCGKGGKQFASDFRNAEDAKKDDAVKLLQMPEGVGAEVWRMLRTDKKYKNPAAVDAVFKWCKERKLGKMPQ